MSKSPSSLVRTGNSAWNTLEIIQNLSKEKYGIDFAKQVANKLKEKKLCCRIHRDYCGYGLDYDEDNDVYGLKTFYDGYPDQTIKIFNTQKEFEKWLSNQSDFSLSGTIIHEDGLFENINGWQVNNQALCRSLMDVFLM
eukprot:TRINITY_DN1896_c0_g1_i2.p1 TRINITY_DN1896_c0_g1~~TRINITY_DN1896_c0_g1_i2.p1  ORF type:complete len:139 (+),score=38.81 TRINITY_DN1896_c0_g1_i2:64-480(+)